MPDGHVLVAGGDETVATGTTGDALAVGGDGCTAAPLVPKSDTDPPARRAATTTPAPPRIHRFAPAPPGG